MSTRTLAAELTRQGHKVSAHTVGDCATTRASACRATPRPSREGSTADRDAQFSDGSASRPASTWRPEDPVVSVDAKKKELVGEFKNGGRERRPKGEPGPGRRP